MDCKYKLNDFEKDAGLQGWNSIDGNICKLCHESVQEHRNDEQYIQGRMAEMKEEMEEIKESYMGMNKVEKMLECMQKQMDLQMELLQKIVSNSRPGQNQQ